MQMLAGAEPDAYKNERGYTALIAACANGDTGHADSDGRDHFQVVERLLEGGAELDQTTKVCVTVFVCVQGCVCAGCV
jgi:ankyrin repeat protein